MKKIYSIIIVLTMIIAMTGCNTRDCSLTISDRKDSDFGQSEDIEFSTQHQVYGKDIERITCFLQNKTNKEIIYGEEYAIEKYQDGDWYQLQFPENTGWNDIAYILAPNSSSTVNINLSFLDYKFTDGTYRVVKKVDDKYYYAKFELGESKITESTPYGFQDLNKLSKNYSKEQAVLDGVVVMTYDGIENSQMIGSFVNDVSRNVPSMLRIIRYTIEGDPIITDITYHVERGEYFTVAHDNSRDNFAGDNKGITETIYSYMVTDKNGIYLSNYAKMEQEGKDNGQEDFLILDDLDNYEWKSIVELVEEMTMNRLVSNSTRYRVFSLDGSKDIMLTENPLEFGYNTDGFGEIRYIEDKLGTAVKIKEALWADENTILLVCETDSELTYYEFFDIQSRSVISYTASAFDYYFENGEILIPE